MRKLALLFAVLTSSFAFAIEGDYIFIASESEYFYYFEEEYDNMTKVTEDNTFTITKDCDGATITTTAMNSNRTEEIISIEDYKMEDGIITGNITGEDGSYAEVYIDTNKGDMLFDMLELDVNRIIHFYSSFDSMEFIQK